jgi:hypothetical protein
MLKALNSTHAMVEVPAFEVLAKRAHTEYVQVSLFD